MIEMYTDEEIVETRKELLDFYAKIKQLYYCDKSVTHYIATESGHFLCLDNEGDVKVLCVCSPTSSYSGCGPVTCLLRCEDVFVSFLKRKETKVTRHGEWISGVSCAEYIVEELMSAKTYVTDSKNTAGVDHIRDLIKEAYARQLHG